MQFLTRCSVSFREPELGLQLISFAPFFQQVEPDSAGYLENTSPYNFRAELEAMTLLQQSLSSAHSLPDPLLRDPASSDLSTAFGVASQSTQDPKAVSGNSWGGLALPILTPPPSESLRLESVEGVAEPALWAPAGDLSPRETELSSHLDPSVEEALLSVYSPPSSSIASSSSCEDIASIVDEKSPVADAGEDSISEDTVKANESQKVRFSESDEEVAGEEESRSEKAIKLPQSRFCDNALL